MDSSQPSEYARGATGARINEVVSQIFLEDDQTNIPSTIDARCKLRTDEGKSRAIVAKQGNRETSSRYGRSGILAKAIT